LVTLRDAITDVQGLTVGHFTDTEAATGCTVVLCDPAAVAGVDVRGAAPGTRETDLLRPSTLVDQVDAIVLAGGSAFGLAAADGVVQFLVAAGRGHLSGYGPVPIVPAAILFDLGLGQAHRPPTAEAGLAAARSAGPDVPQGSVGAGTGATVAKAGGLDTGWKGGIGTASATLADGTVVGALFAVNAFGDIYAEDGTPLALSRDATQPARTAIEHLASGMRLQRAVAANTTIGVVATDAALTKEQAVKLAQIAHDGIALAVRPTHTMVDGDVVFSVATGARPDPVDHWQLTAIGAVATQVVWRSIANAVRHATGHPSVPAVSA
jgi:L-aminopeptidase/D-esterase-like protein